MDIKESIVDLFENEETISGLVDMLVHFVLQVAKKMALCTLLSINTLNLSFFFCFSIIFTIFYYGLLINHFFVHIVVPFFCFFCFCW